MKPPLRLITIVWGDEYVAKLNHITLPAILAPGNLPALASHFACELVLVTERRAFTRIQSSQVFHRLLSYADVQLLPIDDLLSPWYGMTLTLAYHRGFAGLGARVLDYYLVFFNADFVMADGCYQSLAKRILNGDKLIFAPSYCVIEEEVAPLLLTKADPSTGVIAVPPREMAALALSNRHNTIRAKTINDRRFRIHRYDQFFWLIDPNTLLARQLPIAVVSMRPEKVVTDLQTYWDYGLISELCPAAKHCVLSDSDEFLMIELRTRNTLIEHMSLGWPSVQEIADDLASYATKDQLELGHHTLVLHSADLPTNLEETKIELDTFVDSVYQRLPERPVSHLRHKFWLQVSDKFHSQRSRRYLLQQLFCGHKVDTYQPASAADFSEVEVRFSSERKAEANLSFAQQFYDRIIGRVPRLRPAHPEWADLRHALRIVNDIKTEESTKILMIKSSNARFAPFLHTLPGLLVSVPASMLLRHALHPVVDRQLDPSRACFIPPVSDSGPGFDWCFCELNGTDIADFPMLYQNLRCSMRAGSRVIVYLSNMPHRLIHQKDLIPLLGSLSDEDRYSLAFSSLSKSLVARIGRRLFRVGTVLHQRHIRLGAFAFAILSMSAAPFTQMASRRAEQQRSDIMPENCTSVTLEIELGERAQEHGCVPANRRQWKAEKL